MCLNPVFIVSNPFLWVQTPSCGFKSLPVGSHLFLWVPTPSLLHVKTGLDLGHRTSQTNPSTPPSRLRRQSSQVPVLGLLGRISNPGTPPGTRQCVRKALVCWLQGWPGEDFARAQFLAAGNAASAARGGRVPAGRVSTVVS